MKQLLFALLIICLSSCTIQVLTGKPLTKKEQRKYLKRMQDSDAEAAKLFAKEDSMYISKLQETVKQQQAEINYLKVNHIKKQ